MIAYDYKKEEQEQIAPRISTSHTEHNVSGEIEQATITKNTIYTTVRITNTAQT